MLIGACLFWNVLFAITAPKVPADQRIQIYVIDYFVNDDVLQVWEDELLQALPEDQQEVVITSINTQRGQDPNMIQLIFARMAAQDGDVFIMPDYAYREYATSGAFKSMRIYLSQFDLPASYDPDAMITNAEIIDEAGKQVVVDDIFGISAEYLLGLKELGIDPQVVEDEGFTVTPVIALTSYSKNPDNQLRTIEWLITDKLDFVEGTQG